jgi:hypothetical protein
MLHMSSQSTQLKPKYFRSFEAVTKDGLWPFQGLNLDPEATLRHQAIEEVLRRLPKDAYAALVKKSDTFNWFIPYEESGGEVMPFLCTLPEKKNRAGMAVVLYLSPLLERRGFKSVVATVAHELAHIFLEHKLFGAKDYEAQENDAWETIRRWGFATEDRANKRFYQRYHSRQRALYKRLGGDYDVGRDVRLHPRND